MPGPYRLAVVNLILLGVLGSYFVLTRMRRTPEKFPWVVFLLLFGLLAGWSIFRYGTYESGDMSINVIKTIAFYQNLLEGNFIPRWAGDLNATYGYPNFIFAYPLPYYLASLFHFFGFSFLNSVKLVMGIAFIGSGLSMYLFLRSHVESPGAFLGAITYLFAPYHLVDLHFRVDIGELMGLCMVPLVFLGLSRLSRHSGFGPIARTALAFALMVLSHQAIALFACPLILLYGVVICRPKNLNHWSKLTAALILGLGLSAFYWLPAIVEARFTLQAIYPNVIEYLSLSQLLYSPWRFGFLFQGPQGELAYLIGYGQWLLILVSLFFLIRRRLTKPRLALFALITLGILLFAMLPISHYFWNWVPLVRKIQFSSRLLTMVIVLVAVLAAVVAEKLKPRHFDLLVISMMAATLLNWGNRRLFPETTDAYFVRALPLSTARGEGLTPAAPRWVDPGAPWQAQVPPAHLEILSGDATVISQSRTITHHRYEVYVTEASLMRENTLYFPGWQLLDNGERLPISPTTEGLIKFSLTPGLHSISLEFTDTPVGQTAFYMSVLAAVVMLGGLFTGIGRWPVFPVSEAKQ